MICYSAMSLYICLMYNIWLKCCMHFMLSECFSSLLRASFLVDITCLRTNFLFLRNKPCLNNNVKLLLSLFTIKMEIKFLLCCLAFQIFSCFPLCSLVAPSIHISKVSQEFDVSLYDNFLLPSWTTFLFEHFPPQYPVFWQPQILSSDASSKKIEFFCLSLVNPLHVIRSAFWKI